MSSHAGFSTHSLEAMTQKQHDQDHRERRQVAQAKARVGEEEADGWEQNADGRRDLQTQAQDVTHVQRRRLVRVGAQGAVATPNSKPVIRRPVQKAQMLDTDPFTMTPTIMKMQ